MDRRAQARPGRLQLRCAWSGRRARLERDGLHLSSRHQHQRRSALTMADLSHITRFGLPGIGRVAFGVHACLFYSNPDQFVAVLVPLLEGFSKEARIVTEAWRTSPMVIELVRRVPDAQ